GGFRGPSADAAQPGYDPAVSLAPARAGSDAWFGSLGCGCVPRVRLEGICPGVEAANSNATGRPGPAAYARATGNPVPRPRMAGRLLSRQDRRPGQVGASE